MASRKKTTEKKTQTSTGKEFPVALCPYKGRDTETVFAVSETELAVGKKKTARSRAYKMTEAVPADEFYFLFVETKSQSRAIRKAVYAAGLKKIAAATAARPVSVPITEDEFSNPER